MSLEDTDRDIHVVQLESSELEAFHHLDRSERIVGFYRMESGELVGDDRIVVSPTWSEANRQKYINRSRGVVDRGGIAIGGFDGDRLVGFALIDPKGVAYDPSLVQLDLFYVSAGQRGRGIARLLMDEVVARAEALGASGIYISATPSRNTVEIYLHFGAMCCQDPDPYLFAKEPEDIHLVLRVDDYRTAAGMERAG